MLKDGTLSLLIIEIFVSNYKNFERGKIISEFIPLFFDTIEKCRDFTDNWVLTYFPTVIKFILDLGINSESYNDSLQKFFYVFIIYTIESNYFRRIIYKKNCCKINICISRVNIVSCNRLKI